MRKVRILGFLTFLNTNFNISASDVGEMKKERENAGLKFREQDEEKNPSGFPEHGTKFIQAK